MAKEGLETEIGTVKEESLEHQEGRKKTVGRIMGERNRFPAPLEFSKLCVMVEEKIRILIDVILNKCKGNVYDML